MNHESSDKTNLPIVWPLEHDLPSLSANHFAISKTDDGVYIMFGELRPLLFTSEPSPEQIEQLRQKGGIQIKPLASVVVTLRGYKVLTHLLVNALDEEDLQELLDHIQNRIEEKQDAQQ